jgi:hypothetical protein
MSSLGQRLRDEWVATGLPVRPGVGLKEIRAFESRYGISLPPDLRDYFTTVDGIDDDGWMLEFLQLGDVRSVPEALGDYPGYSNIVNTLPNSQAYFVIADFMMGSHVYAIHLSGMVSQETPVLWIIDDQHAKIADSFTEFGERYLIVGAWAL